MRKPRHIQAWVSALCLILLIGGVSLPSQAQEGWIKAHGISTLGELKYPADYTQLDYVNPHAPKGGEIAVSTVGSFDSMHPYGIKGIPGALSSIFFESLLSATADEIGSSYGLLAESLEYPEDRSAVIFNLRPEARFSDGSPVLASDVAFSFKILTEKGMPSYRAVVKPKIKAVDILGRHRIKFTFTEGIETRDLPQTVGDVPVFSEKNYHARGVDFADSTLVPLIGSGPYVLDTIDVGKTLVYKRNDEYWGADLPINRGRNNFDRIRVEYYADGAAAFEGFKSGTYTFRIENSSKSWATGYDFPALEKGWVKRAEIPHQIKAPGQVFVLNLRRDKFKDRRVREAIGLMFNFIWSNETLFYGIYDRDTSFWANSDLAAKGLPSPEELAILEPIADLLPPGVLDAEPFSFPDGSPRLLNRKDLRRAGELLDAAGWSVDDDGLRRNAEGKPLRVEFLSSSQLWDRVVNPYVENLKRLGVKAVYTRVDQAEKVTRTRPPSYDFDIIIDHMQTSYIPGDGLSQYFGSKTADSSFFNTPGLKSPAVDHLITLAMKAKSKAQVKIAVSALDRVLRAEKFVIPSWFKSAHTIAYYDMFEYPEKLPPYALGYLDFWWSNTNKASELKTVGAFR